MNSVIKGASYVLAHTPDMVLYNGTTQTTERIVNPDSEYLKEVPEHLRSYEDCVAYWPNQTYIGNVHPDELAQVEEEQRGKADDGKAEPWIASPRSPPEAEHTITGHGAHPILSGWNIAFEQVFSHCRRRKWHLSMAKRHKNRKSTQKRPKKAPARILKPGRGKLRLRKKRLHV